MIDRAILIHVPSRWAGGENDIPIGLLYVAGVLEQMNIEVRIYDIYLKKIPTDDPYGWAELQREIQDFKPQLIGFGGIATSYMWTKKLSRRIKTHYPDIFQIAGGALSSAFDLLLTRTAVDAVFHGEIELTLPEVIERIRSGRPWQTVLGISCLGPTGVQRNAPGPQVKHLDDIPIPPYHLIDIEDYLLASDNFLAAYRADMEDQGLYADIARRLEDVPAFLPIVSSRGCTNKCSFCYRQQRGYRKHSVDYIIRHIDYLKEKFGVKGISFRDELFNGNEKWVLALCDTLIARDQDIAYITSARADRLSTTMLRKMYRSGCVDLLFGQESGSPKILKEYRKNVTPAQNLRATLLTRAAGIYSTVQIVIGSPGENEHTIAETTAFLQQAGIRHFSLNYLIPLPEAPIWEYVQENNLIPDVEHYLETVARIGGEPLINLTRVPDRQWRLWGKQITFKVQFYYAVKHKLFFTCVRLLVTYPLKVWIPPKIKPRLREILSRALPIPRLRAWLNV